MNHRKSLGIIAQHGNMAHNTYNNEMFEGSKEKTVKTREGTKGSLQVIVDMESNDDVCNMAIDVREGLSNTWKRVHMISLQRHKSYSKLSTRKSRRS